MPEYKHRVLECSIAIKDNLKQADLIAFEKAYREKDREGLNEERAAVVLAAIHAGWTTNLNGFDVLEADPRIVRWMASKINARYTEVTEVPPE